VRQQQSNNKKVFVGLSGGVDSAVSAALLQKAGYDVTGVFIKIQIPGYPCPAARDRIEAMRVAAYLTIPFIEVDLSKEYEQEVFLPSIEEFKKGNTPNPDTLCNEKIKFGVFFEFCMRRGADIVATGHYAQMQEGHLYMGADSNKDQSYFLWGAPEASLRRTLFPVGGLEKPEVRRLAKKIGLPNAARADSQGLCFLGDISVEDMLVREASPMPGDVLNEEGEHIGTHNGAALYTLGQRHGFSLSHDVLHDTPRYVIAKDMKKNTITVSAQKYPRGMQKTSVALERTNWIGAAGEGSCEARYRYRQALISAELAADKTSVVLVEPQYVPLGQSLVLYQGRRCLGGGVIKNATLSA
jgi:tRNA-specific 2-thiouridylase